jgi:hypothetical protein
MQIDLTVRHLLYSILMGPGDYKDIGPRNTAFLLVVFGGLVLFAVWDKIAGSEGSIIGFICWLFH